jgi:hypothetical protein
MGKLKMKLEEKKKQEKKKKVFLPRNKWKALCKIVK